MPLYEYRCSQCGKTFEVIQKFADQPLSVHEGCGGNVQRLISPSAFQFKGTGWYVTDYGRNGKSRDRSKPASSDGKESAKESKPAKAEPKSEGSPAPQATASPAH